jgi:histidinol-phosphate aminotransferase
MLCGHPDIIRQVDKVRLPYNINVLTQVTAEFVLEHIDVLDQQAAQIREQRTVMLEAMREMDGLQVFASDANFILFRVLENEATAVFEAIREQGVLIKNMKASAGLLKNCLRVTVGTPEENRAFLAALDVALTGS